jgi:hypothetical protein
MVSWVTFGIGAGEHHSAVREGERLDGLLERWTWTPRRHDTYVGSVDEPRRRARRSVTR